MIQNVAGHGGIQNAFRCPYVESVKRKVAGHVDRAPFETFVITAEAGIQSCGRGVLVPSGNWRTIFMVVRSAHL